MYSWRCKINMVRIDKFRLVNIKEEGILGTTCMSTFLKLIEALQHVDKLCSQSCLLVPQAYLFIYCHMRCIIEQQMVWYCMALIETPPATALSTLLALTLRISVY